MGGKSVMQFRDKSVKTFEGKIPPLGYMALVEIWFLFRKIDSLSSKIDISDPYSSLKNGAELDSMSLESWLTANTWTKSVADLVGAMIRGAGGVEPADMSFLAMLTSVKSNGGMGEQGEELVFEEGAISVINSLADELKADVNILLSQQVDKIDQNDQENVLVSTAGGRVFKCRRVVVCVPPQNLGKIAWSPNISPSKLSAIDSVGDTRIIRVMVHFDDFFWKKQGYSGAMVVLNPDGPLSGGMDDSDDKNATLVTILGGKNAEKWSDRPEDEL